MDSVRWSSPHQNQACICTYTDATFIAHKFSHTATCTDVVISGEGGIGIGVGIGISVGTVLTAIAFVTGWIVYKKTCAPQPQPPPVVSNAGEEEQLLKFKWTKRHATTTATVTMIIILLA